MPSGGPCPGQGVPPRLTPLSPQPSTAPSPGSTGASPGRTPSSSSAVRAWWTGTGPWGGGFGVPGAPWGDMKLQGGAGARGLQGFSVPGGIQDMCGVGVSDPRGVVTPRILQGLGDTQVPGRTQRFPEIPGGTRLLPGLHRGFVGPPWVTMGGQRGPGVSSDTPGARRVFLVRESQRNPKGFVLSLCHLQRIKHYLILPVSASVGLGGLGGARETGPDLQPPGRARRRVGSTSPWTTGRRASPTSSSSWSSTRSTVASCPASCGTTAPAWPSEPRHGTTERVWHSLALPAWLGTVWHCWRPLAQSHCRCSTA